MTALDEWRLVIMDQALQMGLNCYIGEPDGWGSHRCLFFVNNPLVNQRVALQRMARQITKRWVLEFAIDTFRTDQWYAIFKSIRECKEAMRRRTQAGRRQHSQNEGRARPDEERVQDSTQLLLPLAHRWSDGVVT